MERLTERLENGVINVKYASQHETAIHRLVTIENILGDEYDLDELREMVQAKREGRCVVLSRLEPGRGDPAGELGEPGPPGVPWSPGRHKTYNELIKWLRTASGSPGGVKMSNAAADALAGLQAENVYMRKLLHQSKEFV